MINLKTEEFVLDMNTLQALQQLLQWVGDFVLYLLASLPNQVRPRSCLEAPPTQEPHPWPCPLKPHLPAPAPPRRPLPPGPAEVLGCCTR